MSTDIRQMRHGATAHLDIRMDIMDIAVVAVCWQGEGDVSRQRNASS